MKDRACAPSKETPYYQIKMIPDYFVPALKNFHAGRLVENGYTRLLDVFLRCASPFCQKCYSIRIPVAPFHPNRAQKRLLKKTSIFSTIVNENPDIEEHTALFFSYMKARHPDTYSKLPTAEKSKINHYRNHILQKEHIPYHCFEIRNTSGTLKSICLFLPIENGLYLGQIFYDPKDKEVSALGILTILKMIDLAHDEEKPYIFLGDWTQEKGPYHYKSQFKPFEILTQDGWLRLSQETSGEELKFKPPRPEEFTITELDT